MSKISDEVIISALIQNGTLKETASTLGVSERMLYDRMNTGEFKALYKSAKADIVRKAIFELNNQVGKAVETVVSIMNDKSVNPSIRLQASQTILNNANKFSERLNVEENRVSAQRDDNVFDNMFSF